jgi:hypothetical protein
MKNMKYLLLIFILSGCGAGFHVKRAKYHLMKAEMKGASVKQDTVFKEIVLKVPGVKVEFIPKPLVVNDTLYFEKDRVITKVLVKNIPGKTNTVYVKTECPDARIESKVPVTVNTKITAKAGINWKTLALSVILAFILGFLTKMFLPVIRKLIIGI